MEKKTELNYGAIILTGLMAFGLSTMYYSPLLFGEIWDKFRHAPNPEVPQWTMVLAPFRELLVSYVLAKLIVRLNLRDWKDTTKLMLLLWLAFHAVGMAGAVLWDNMQWQLGAVHAGDWLMKMFFMGIVLPFWLNQKF
jgi:hypothetical protein